MTDAFWLRHGPHEVEVDPGFGGRVTVFRTRDGRRWIDWFAPTPAEGRSSGTSPGAGMFPLVPFSNRIRDATLRTPGGGVRLTATERGKPHAIHGHGRSRAWTVEEAGDGHAVLSYAYDTGDWPWPYTAWQRIDLGEVGLTVSLIVENRSVAAMPVGIGFHPFLPLGEGVRLTAGFETIWPAVADSIPKGPTSLPDELDFADGRPLPVGLDTGFGGWDGRALIEWPEEDRSLELRADGAFGHCILFTPEGRDFLCVEPVSHAIDGFNLEAAGVAGTGTRWLTPGERMGGVIKATPNP